VNGTSTVRQSDSNLINSSALGLTGVTFSATGTGTTQLTVAPDVTTIAAAINAFVAQYNSTQNIIADFTHVDTADVAKNGSLATDTNLTFLAPDLRAITSGSTSNTAVIRMLSDLGVNTNANDNTLTQVNTSDLQNALTNNLSDVISMFEDPTTGLTNTVQTVIAQYNDSLNGSIVNEQNAIKQEITFNQNQITQMQAQIAVEQTNLENEFAALDAMEAQDQSLSGILNSSSGSSSSSSGSSASPTPTSIGSVGSSTN
jgi:flagellar hook-associated protein 2